MDARSARVDSSLLQKRCERCKEAKWLPTLRTTAEDDTTHSDVRRQNAMTHGGEGIERLRFSDGTAAEDGAGDVRLKTDMIRGEGKDDPQLEMMLATFG